jgi:uncharacterized protein YndB with AHSA1/START domain
MTMHVFTHTIWIAKPPVVVFDFFTDFAQAPRWRRFVTEMRLAGPPPLGVGSDIAVSMEVGGTSFDVSMKVLTFERPSRWRHHTDEPYYDGAIEYTFTPEGEGTRVTLTCTARPLGLYGWLGLPLVWMRAGKSYAGQLPSLKRAMEE